MIEDFRAFMTKTNALALAIGVIIGAAVGKIVAALSNDVLMPVIALFLPGGGWREARFVLTRSVDASGEVVENAILYGHFLGAILDFLIISFVVFLIVKALIKPPPAPVVAPSRECPECLETIPLAARRCRACTAVLPPAEPVAV